MNNKISTPIALKLELQGVNDIDTATAILRRAEWKLIREMRENFLDTRSFSEIGTRNETLLSFCTMLLEWVRHFHGGTDQSIVERDLDTHSINELLKPFERLRKMVR